MLRKLALALLGSALIYGVLMAITLRRLSVKGKAKRRRVPVVHTPSTPTGSDGGGFIAE